MKKVKAWAIVTFENGKNCFIARPVNRGRVEIWDNKSNAETRGMFLNGCEGVIPVWITPIKKGEKP